MSVFRRIMESQCTCHHLGPPKRDAPPSRGLLVVTHGQGFLLEYIGHELNYELEAVGMLEAFRGYDDGVWVLSARIVAHQDYYGDVDTELQCELEPVTEEQWKAWCDKQEPPWTETLEDYHEPPPPCEVHGV